ncbi:MAG: DUF3795 domain-containing protein [Thermoplasmata archaeon]
MVKEKILSRCGYRCDLCLAYKENIELNDRRKILSDGWYKYFGFRIPADEIYCEGCITSDSVEADLIDKNCPVRPCVISKNIENCSRCEEYICDKLKTRLVSYEEIVKEYSENIPKKDRELIINPYENKKRLEKMRK